MEEKALISSCVQGEEQAQKQFYQLYLPYVFSLARRFGVAKHDIKDVVQEVFIEIFVSLPRFKNGKAPLKPWLKTIAIRKIVRHQRKHTHWATTDYQEELHAPASHPLKLPDNCDCDLIKGIIRQLPDGFREIFNLKVIDGYSHQEIAKMLSISASTSRSQLSRAKAIIREKLSKSTCYDQQ